MGENAFEANDANFEEKVVKQSAKQPVAADFWAAWCMPCQLLGPTMEKLANEFKGKFVLAKINVDQNPGLSGKFAISSIPSVKMFKGGKVVDEFTGALPEQAVRKWIEKNI